MAGLDKSLHLGSSMGNESTFDLSVGSWKIPKLLEILNAVDMERFLEKSLMLI